MQEKTCLGHSPLGFHRIAYTEWGQPAPHPPVVCVHGLTRNGRDFDYLAIALAAGSQVFCPDIAGRGKSDWLADPTLYNYTQYAGDMTALLARTGADVVDWVGTSMGGIIGMMLAADATTPIRKLVINDVGPFIPLAALHRIGAYVAEAPEFSDLAALEKHIRTIYASFGPLSDEQWRHLATHSVRKLANGKLALAHDPAIARLFSAVDRDVDFWDVYDRIRCPVLLLRGAKSDILPADVAQQMTQRGPRARLIEFPRIGHAPALMDAAQIAAIAEFLRP